MAADKQRRSHSLRRTRFPLPRRQVWKMRISRVLLGNATAWWKTTCPGNRFIIAPGRDLHAPCCVVQQASGDWLWKLWAFWYSVRSAGPVFPLVRCGLSGFSKSGHRVNLLQMSDLVTQSTFPARSITTTERNKRKVSVLKNRRRTDFRRSTRRYVRTELPLNRCVFLWSVWR